MSRCAYELGIFIFLYYLFCLCLLPLLPIDEEPTSLWSIEDKYGNWCHCRPLQQEETRTEFLMALMGPLGVFAAFTVIHLCAMFYHDRKPQERRMLLVSLNVLGIIFAVLLYGYAIFIMHATASGRLASRTYVGELGCTETDLNQGSVQKVKAPSQFVKSALGCKYIEWQVDTGCTFDRLEKPDELELKFTNGQLVDWHKQCFKFTSSIKAKELVVTYGYFSLMAGASLSVVYYAFIWATAARANLGLGERVN